VSELSYPLNCAPTEEQISTTITAKQIVYQTQNSIKMTASYFIHLTQTAEPSKTPWPTSTPDKRSDFDKCEQSGNGVRYTISASGNVNGVSLTWENDTGGTNQGDYHVPFCKTYNNFGSGDFVYISAQIIEPTSGAGSIVCKIYQGDSVIAEAEASGFPNIATCSGSTF
jgi:hypothetical protein